MKQSNMPSITVAFVDDHTDILQHVAYYLQTHHTCITVSFIARDGADMKAQISLKGPPQVVVMDVQMPTIDGYRATEWLGTRFPDVRVIAYSAFVTTNTINDMLLYGARGILAKGSGSDSLAEAILAVASRGYYLNEYVTEQVLRSLRRGSLPKGIGKIPDRRRTVLELCHEGLLDKQIADRMGISVNSVADHFRSLFVQFDVHDRVSLISKAMACGLLPHQRPTQ
ncbi:response regulator [Parapedobacter deserti]|uniref:Response regulator n=1 Tax=Parapedobacter deserti TaxID=1912957 RepID=A0ABV7JPH4_9SPHI